MSSTITLLGLGLSQDGASQNRLSFGVGVEGVLLWDENQGFYLGIEWVSRGAELVSGNAASAQFLDFPFGVWWDLGLATWGNSFSFIVLGGYFSWPLSDLRSENQIIQRTRKTLGAYLRLSHGWYLLSSVTLNFSSWVKFSVWDTYETSPLGSLQRTLDLGGGLSLHYCF